MNYLRNVRAARTNRSYNSNSQEAQSNVELRRHPDEFRIESILSAIQRGKFKYYVCGGFNRSRGLRMDPLRLAKYHNLNLDHCLFEIKDQRIEDAVNQYGLTRINPNTFRETKPKSATYAYPRLKPRQISFNQVMELGE